LNKLLDFVCYLELCVLAEVLIHLSLCSKQLSPFIISKPYTIGPSYFLLQFGMVRLWPITWQPLG